MRAKQYIWRLLRSKARILKQEQSLQNQQGLSALFIKARQYFWFSHWFLLYFVGQGTEPPLSAPEAVDAQDVGQSWVRSMMFPPVVQA